MTFDKFNRRTHLYVGLTLLPWFFMYGLSSFPLAHKSAPAKWTVRSEREYSLPPVEAGANLDTVGDQLIQACGLNADLRHGAYRDGQGNLQVYMARFITPTRINYSPAKRRATVETRDFALPQILVEMHGRGGFEKGGFLDMSWSVIVDLVCIAIVTWVLSGVYMWWHLRRLRFWGTVALVGGIGSFLIFMWAL
jgi:hypothetical protein